MDRRWTAFSSDIRQVGGLENQKYHSTHWRPPKIKHTARSLVRGPQPSKGPPPSLRLVLPSDYVNIALNGDIRQVGGLECQKYCQEPIFEDYNMSRRPPAAPWLVLPSEYVNIAFSSDIRQAGGLESQKYCQERIFEDYCKSRRPPSAPWLVLLPLNSIIALSCDIPHVIDIPHTGDLRKSTIPTGASHIMAICSPAALRVVLLPRSLNIAVSIDVRHVRGPKIQEHGHEPIFESCGMSKTLRRLCDSPYHHNMRVSPSAAISNSLEAAKVKDFGTFFYTPLLLTSTRQDRNCWTLVRRRWPSARGYGGNVCALLGGAGPRVP